MSLLDGNKDQDSKDNWRERDEKMENGDLSPDNNNTLDKNRNGVLPPASPEPDNLSTLFNNGQNFRDFYTREISSLLSATL